MYDFRTDLAVERSEIFRKINKIENNIDGIESEEETDEKVKITRVRVVNEKGVQAIGKPAGNYITLDIEGLKYGTEEELSKASEKLRTGVEKINRCT